MTDLLYGRNAIREALRSKRRSYRRLFIASGVQKNVLLTEIIELATSIQLPIEYIDRHVLDKRVRAANHQGVVLEAGGYPYGDVEESLAQAEQCREFVLLLLLDHVQDVHNVGTLLRTAEVVGTHGILLPERRAAEITPAVVNASSGATEHLKIAIVSNLTQSIALLKRRGIWVVGVENDERAKDFDTVDFNVPLALVVGAEGSGLARLTRDRCDFLVRLPMHGHITSLNVAVAGSIVLYHAWRQRQQHRKHAS